MSTPVQSTSIASSFFTSDLPIFVLQESQRHEINRGRKRTELGPHPRPFLPLVRSYHDPFRISGGLTVVLDCF